MCFLFLKSAYNLYCVPTCIYFKKYTLLSFSLSLTNTLQKKAQHNKLHLFHNTIYQNYDIFFVIVVVSNVATLLHI